MTSLGLLLWIVSGIAAQVALFLAISFWQHWQEYLAIKDAGPVAAVTPPVSTESEAVSSAAAWKGYRPFKLVRRQIEDPAGSICSFYLQPEDGLPLPTYKPGQFLTFRLDIPRADGTHEEVIRCYSLSDAPHPDHYRVSIKRVFPPPGSDFPPGRSSNFFHEHVAVGTTLQVRAPSGHFYIDRSDAPVVLIAGGIGITPMLAMANWSLTEQPGREIWLYYGVRNSAEAAMSGHLRALAEMHANFHLRMCFSDPQATDQLDAEFHHRGRVGVPLFRTELPLKPYHYYICGPTPMLETMVPALEEWGVPDSRIHFEAFGPASIKRRVSPNPGKAPIEESASNIVITFAKSGKQLPWSPTADSLLDFAEGNGISVDSGCRAGGCGSCQTVIQSGEVIYRQTPDYDPEPGSCLLCTCVPKTNVTLEA
jgi:ferredoxin-NADP reductase